MSADQRPIQLPVTLDAATRRRDRSVSVRLTTTLEVSNEDMTELDKRFGRAGWFVFAERELEDTDIPTEPVHGKEFIPKIQRLRGVMWHVWEKRTDQSEPFEVWWDRQFEELMTKYRALRE